MAEELNAAAPTTPDIDVEQFRPKTRADCEDGLRPCPFISCRYNLLADVSGNGSLQIYTHQQRVSCALDEAARGGMTLTEVGEVLDITRERTRQLECQALAKLRVACVHPEKS